MRLEASAMRLEASASARRRAALSWASRGNVPGGAGGSCSRVSPEFRAKASHANKASMPVYSGGSGGGFGLGAAQLMYSGGSGFGFGFRQNHLSTAFKYPEPLQELSSLGGALKGVCGGAFLGIDASSGGGASVWESPEKVSPICTKSGSCEGGLNNGGAFLGGEMCGIFTGGTALVRGGAAGPPATPKDRPGGGAICAATIAGMSGSVLESDRGCDSKVCSKLCSDGDADWQFGHSFRMHAHSIPAGQ